MHLAKTTAAAFVLGIVLVTTLLAGSAKATPAYLPINHPAQVSAWLAKVVRHSKYTNVRITAANRSRIALVGTERSDHSRWTFSFIKTGRLTMLGKTHTHGYTGQLFVNLANEPGFRVPPGYDL